MPWNIPDDFEDYDGFDGLYGQRAPRRRGTGVPRPPTPKCPAKRAGHSSKRRLVSCARQRQALARCRVRGKFAPPAACGGGGGWWGGAPEVVPPAPFRGAVESPEDWMRMPTSGVADNVRAIADGIRARLSALFGG